ncbi:unnamed protein product, partial [Symbiodinium microadriaticum]
VTPFFGKPFPVGQLPKAWFRWNPVPKRSSPVLPIAGSIPGTVPVGRQPPKAKAARDTWLRVVKAKPAVVPAKSPVFMQPTGKFPAHFRSFGCSEEQAVETDVESPEAPPLPDDAGDEGNDDSSSGEQGPGAGQSSESSSGRKRRLRKEKKKKRKDEKRRRKMEEERLRKVKEEEARRRRREAAAARVAHKRQVELARASRPIILSQDESLAELAKRHRE